jgi:Domain of unknown function (DUF4398)
LGDADLRTLLTPHRMQIAFDVDVPNGHNIEDLTMPTRIAVLIAAALLAGCATQSERPTQDMARAQALIDQAEKAGAQRYAAVQLDQARQKLDLAKAADQKGRHDDAQQRATEAAADAELAVAMASSGEAQRAAAEVQQSVETLREEAQRNSAISSSNLDDSLNDATPNDLN